MITTVKGLQAVEIMADIYVYAADKLEFMRQWIKQNEGIESLKAAEEAWADEYRRRKALDAGELETQ